MIFINILDRRFPTTKSKRKSGYALYRCPKCSKEVELIKNKNHEEDDIVCKDCALLERGTTRTKRKLKAVWRRSEERRVGKECRDGGATSDEKR